MNEFIVTVDNKKNKVIVLNDSEVIFNDEKFNFELIPSGCQSYILRLNEKLYEVTSSKLSSDTYSILVGGNIFEATVRTALQEKAIRLIEEAQSSSHHVQNVKAPMPGLILKIKRKENETIAQGDSVMILEAMKMENDLRAPLSGQIKKIHVSEGTAVEKGTVLFTIE